MASTVNLLPTEMATGKEVGQFLKKLKTINFLILLLTIVIAGGGMAGYYILSQELTSINNDKTTLTSTIQSLESTEQSLVLLKDRMQKINQVLASRSVEDSFTRQKEIVDNLPEGAMLKESEIASDKSNLDVLSESSSAIVQISSNLTNGSFKNILLDSVTFTPLIGYLLSFKIQ